MTGLFDMLCYNGLWHAPKALPLGVAIEPGDVALFKARTMRYSKDSQCLTHSSVTVVNRTRVPCTARN